MENKIQDVLTKLHEDTVKNVMIIDAIERNLGDILINNGTSILIRVKHAYLISSSDAKDVDLINETLRKEIKGEDYPMLLVHQEWLANALFNTLDYIEMVPYLNAIVPKDLEIKEVNIEGLELKELSQDDFNFVRETYKLVNSDQYIRSRIDYGMIGAWYKGKLVGFAGEHDLGSMGLLEVLPEYRRLKIATATSNAMIKRVRSQNRYPYTNTSPTNTASIKLQEHNGFKISKEPVYWLFK